MNHLRPLIAAIFPMFLASCGTVTRDVSKTELETRLVADTRKQEEAGGRPYYQWSYIGSDSKHHYFRRQVGRVFVSEALDGIYRLPRGALNLQEAEFKRPQPDNSTRWKQAFTQRGRHGDNYSIRFGVDGATE